MADMNFDTVDFMHTPNLEVYPDHINALSALRNVQHDAGILPNIL